MRISESRTAADGPRRGRRREPAVVGKDGALPDENKNSLTLLNKSPKIVQLCLEK
jgi:hypothetical protein